MMANDSVLNVILIGRNIETRIVFKNASSKQDKVRTVGDYFCLDRAIGHSNISKMEKSDIIFPDTKDNGRDCSIDVRKIRDYEKFSDCSLVVFDSNSLLRDTNGIFSEGADDFLRLKKIIGNIMSIHWNSNQTKGTRQNYFMVRPTPETSLLQSKCFTLLLNMTTIILFKYSLIHFCTLN